ncbi:MAG: transposase [Anaerolineales bacterium]|uniref:IS3 family transposase n=1 Tax=Candidatus Villigracilis vicinus TaxID=3140679 RepID=UPI003136DE93|nr:transposase [Anaerolineales bacterium]
MCEFFGVSRAAYYAWVKKLAETDPDQERMQKIQTVYEDSHKSYGYRRITIHLQRKLGLSINHKAVLRLWASWAFVRKPESPKCTKN